MREVVAAVIVSPQHVLLGLRSPERRLYPNVWDIFGGHVEPGESNEQALLRELDEELGIVATEWRYLSTFDEPQVERYGEARYHFYLVTAWRGEPHNRQPHEHSEIAWFSFAEAQHLSLADPRYVELFDQIASKGV
ncbi:MAG TPA: NUDIX domain-containing protein [Roseiflexaceae bacterium]|nr:NUDIX domain-containing protein [Roseiflexaceae bacterium]